MAAFPAAQNGDNSGLGISCTEYKNGPELPVARDTDVVGFAVFRQVALGRIKGSVQLRNDDMSRLFVVEPGCNALLKLMDGVGRDEKVANKQDGSPQVSRGRHYSLSWAVSDSIVSVSL